MLRSVYSREHRTELIQMTVLGGAATAQLFRSNAALLCGPSWAAPHAVGAKCAKANKDETTSCWTPTRGEAAFEYWVALMVPSGVQPAQRSALYSGHRPPYKQMARVEAWLVNRRMSLVQNQFGSADQRHCALPHHSSTFFSGCPNWGTARNRFNPCYWRRG